MGLDRIAAVALDNSLCAALAAIGLALLFRAGHILVDSYTKLVAETVWLTVSNWLVAIFAAVLLRRPPALAETIAEQLDWLASYHADGVVGFGLLRHGADLAIHLRATAAAKSQAAAQRPEPPTP